MSYNVNLKILSKSEVEELLDVRETVEIVEKTFKDMNEGQIFHPVKEPIWVNDALTNMLMAMPAYLKKDNIAGVKWVNMYKDQVQGIPSSAGHILILSDTKNGQPYALLESTSITAIRTAGGHAVVAAKYLAKKNSKVLTVIGCGRQASTGIRSLTEFFDFEKIKIFCLDSEGMKKIKEDFKDKVEVMICENSVEAAKDADIVLMATTSRVPLLTYKDIPKGCLILGLYSLYDLEPSISKKAEKWILGSSDTDYHQIIKDPLLDKYNLSMEDVYADLGEIVNNKKAARENDDEIILYSHLGMGALDVAIGEKLYKKAVEKNMGTDIKLI